MVYVIHKVHFIENGGEKETSVDFNNIICFTSWKKAESFVKQSLTECENMPPYIAREEDLSRYEYKDYAKRVVRYIQQEYFCGVRGEYIIVQPDIR